MALYRCVNADCACEIAYQLIHLQINRGHDIHFHFPPQHWRIHAFLSVPVTIKGIGKK